MYNEFNSKMKMHSLLSQYWTPSSIFLSIRFSVYNRKQRRDIILHQFKALDKESNCMLLVYVYVCV